MPLVQAKCENCGGILTVNSNLKAANCPHCGAAYIVQDAINNYNTFTRIENLHAGVVNVSSENSVEGRLRAADAYLKLNDYGRALNEYDQVTKLVPQDYRGWWGKAVSESINFSRRLRWIGEDPNIYESVYISGIEASDRSLMSNLEQYARSIDVFAPSDKRSQLLLTINNYIDLLKENELLLRRKEKVEIKINTERFKLNARNKEIKPISVTEAIRESDIDKTFLVVFIICAISGFIALTDKHGPFSDYKWIIAFAAWLPLVIYSLIIINNTKKIINKQKEEQNNLIGQNNDIENERKEARANLPSLEAELDDINRRLREIGCSDKPIAEHRILPTK